MLLVSYAIARVFVLDLHSAVCGSNWKRRPLVVDGNDMKPVNQQCCWTRSYTISLVMREIGFISKCQSVSTPATTGCVFRQVETGR